eukprot:scaffold7781_cov57-Phaeocystis_antarctica.AAC.7
MCAGGRPDLHFQHNVNVNVAVGTDCELVEPLISSLHARAESGAQERVLLAGGTAPREERDQLVLFLESELEPVVAIVEDGVTAQADGVTLWQRTRIGALLFGCVNLLRRVAALRHVAWVVTARRAMLVNVRARPVRPWVTAPAARVAWPPPLAAPWWWASQDGNTMRNFLLAAASGRGAIVARGGRRGPRARAYEARRGRCRGRGSGRAHRARIGATAWANHKRTRAAGAAAAAVRIISRDELAY